MVSSSEENAVLIGGAFEEQGNLISGNRSENVVVRGAGTTLAGNLIGPDRAGFTSLSSRANALENFHGVVLETEGPTLIGLPVTGGGNTISGNTGAAGVTASGRGGHVIRNNRIGTSPDGTAAVPNDVGVDFSDAGDIQIGGSNPASGNLVSGNRVGVQLTRTAANVSVQGNTIGLGTGGIPLPTISESMR